MQDGRPRMYTFVRQIYQLGTTGSIVALRFCEEVGGGIVTVMYQVGFDSQGVVCGDSGVLLDRTELQFVVSV